MVSTEDKVIWFYEQSKMEEWWKANQTLGFHYGYYEKGYRTHTRAILHMNDVVWGLLGLEKNKPAQVLDAGCGIGGTSIYLAKKYPAITFMGITLVPGERTLAKALAAQHQVVGNTNFYEGNYCKTLFADNSFDGVFALESINYARNIHKFTAEMHRVLKPGGRLVVLDGFRTHKGLSPLMQRSYHHWLYGRAIDELQSIDEFIDSLTKQDFHHISSDDLSLHTAPSHLRGFLIGLPFFFSILVKSIVSMNRYRRLDNDFSMGVSFCGGLLAFGGYAKYYAISATK